MAGLSFGPPTAVAAMTVAQAAILAVVMVVREQPPATAATAVLESGPGLLAMARSLVRGMLAPQALRAAVAAFLLKVMPAAFFVLMLVQLIERFGWSRERFSTVSGGVGVLLGFAASVAAGFLASRFGPRRTAVVASVALGVAWIAFGLAARWWDRTDVVFGLVAAETICLAATTVSLFSIFMRVASPAVAATQFTASMAIMNLATSTGSWLAGPLGDLVSTPTAFLIAGCIQPLLGLLVPSGTAAGVSSAHDF